MPRKKNKKQIPAKASDTVTLVSAPPSSDVIITQPAFLKQNDGEKIDYLPKFALQSSFASLAPLVEEPVAKVQTPNKTLPVRTQQFIRNLGLFSAFSKLDIKELRQAKENKKKYDEIVKQAKIALEKEDTHETSLHIGDAIKMLPRRPEAYQVRGQLEEKMRNFVTAIHQYSLALELAPNHADTLSRRGALYSKLGDTEKSKTDIDKAEALRKQAKEDKVKKDAIYRHVNYLADITAKLQGGDFQYHAEDRPIPTHKLMFPEIARLVYRSQLEGNITKADEFYRKALYLCNYNTVLLLDRGLRWRAFDITVTIECFERIIDLTVFNTHIALRFTNLKLEHALSRLFLSELFLQQGKKEEAKEYLSHYMHDDPTGNILSEAVARKWVHQEKISLTMQTCLKQWAQDQLAKIPHHDEKKTSRKFQHQKCLEKIAREPFNHQHHVDFARSQRTVNLDSTIQSISVAIYLLERKLSQSPTAKTDKVGPLRVFRRDVFFEAGHFKQSFAEHQLAIIAINKEISLDVKRPTQAGIIQHVTQNELTYEFYEALLKKANEELLSDEEAKPFSEAAAQFLEANSLLLADPRFKMKAHILAGDIYRQSRKDAEAEKEYKAALELAPDDKKLRIKYRSIRAALYDDHVPALPTPVKEEEKSKKKKKKKVVAHTHFQPAAHPSNPSHNPTAAIREVLAKEEAEQKSTKEDETNTLTSSQQSSRKKIRNARKHRLNYLANQDRMAVQDETAVQHTHLPTATAAEASPQPAKTDIVLSDAKKNASKTTTKKVEEKKEKSLCFYASTPLPRVGIITLLTPEKQILDLLIEQNEIAFTIAGSVILRLNGGVPNKNVDVDIFTSCLPEKVLELLSPLFDIRKTKGPNLLRIFYGEVQIDLMCHPILREQRSITALVQTLDFVSALYAADEKGRVWYLGSPEQEALAKSGEIHTVIPADASLLKDPMRALRAVDTGSKTGKSLSKELAEAMKKHGPALIKEENRALTNHHMYRLFSHGRAPANSSRLLDWKMLEMLFSVQDARYLDNDRKWLTSELKLMEDSQRVSLNWVYALLIVSILNQSPTSPGLLLSILNRPLFKKQFGEYKHLDTLLYSAQQRWTSSHQAPTPPVLPAGPAVNTPSRTLAP